VCIGDNYFEQNFVSLERIIRNYCIIIQIKYSVLDRISCQTFSKQIIGGITVILVKEIKEELLSMVGHDFRYKQHAVCHAVQNKLCKAQLA